jgi:hypothetical protein
MTKLTKKNDIQLKKAPSEPKLINQTRNLSHAPSWT